MMCDKLHKCSHDGCDAKCHKEFCRKHAPKNFKLVPCKWETCTRKCRADYCYYHTPATVAKRLEYNRQYQLAKKLH